MMVFPHAKINLGLHITARRPDGFHNIETLLYPVPLRDALEIIRDGEEGIELASSGLPVPGDPAGNLILKACQLVNEHLKHTPECNLHALPPLRIHLHKVIPMGAGLGGGSSDGAFTILLLNRMFDLGLSAATMERIAGQLGSDCPFFIGDRPVYARERGNQFTPAANLLAGTHVAIVKPPVHVSTREAYAMVTPRRPVRPLEEILRLPVEAWRDLLSNDFEEPVCNHHPEIGAIKDKLYHLGALYASMSGSGAAVYGIFAGPPPIEGEFRGCFSWVSAL